MHRELGEALRANGDKLGTLAEFQEAVRLKPGDIAVLNQLVRALRAVGDAAGARAVQTEGMTRARELFRELRLAQQLLNKKNFPGAIGVYREALKREPQSAEAQRQLADALRRNGELDAAIAAFHTAIQLEPDRGFNHNNLGLALEKKGDLEGAIAEFRAAIQIDGGGKDGRHTNLARVLMARRDFDGAITEYREAIRIGPVTPGMHVNLGKALRAKEDLKGAIAAFRDALRLEPDDAAAREQLVTALKAAGDTAGALAVARGGLAVLDDLIREQPKHTRYRVARARSLIALGRRDEAAAEFAQALPLVPAYDPFASNDPTGVYPAAVEDTEVFEWLTRLRGAEVRKLLTARVRHLGRQREWRQAAAALTRLNALDCAAGYIWSHSEATFLSWVGDREGYRRACRELLERFGTSDNPVLVSQVVFACLLEPDGVADLGKLAPLVDRFAEKAPPDLDTSSILAAGFYEYRRGHYGAALIGSDRCRRRWPRPVPIRPAGPRPVSSGRWPTRSSIRETMPAGSSPWPSPRRSR